MYFLLCVSKTEKHHKNREAETDKHQNMIIFKLKHCSTAIENYYIENISWPLKIYKNISDE